jgi:hypothetical protein
MQEFDGPHLRESAAKLDLALIGPAGVYFNPDTLQIFCAFQFTRGFGKRAGLFQARSSAFQAFF